eukprot:gene14699-20739_t
MADVKLLGELYNYTLCNSSPIFETLYLLITCGHYLPPELAEKLDAPDDFFRVRMVCVLLETCGMYFNEGRARAKLDRYLTFFQAYVLSKVQPVPLDDVIHHLRPKMERYQTYEEALEAVTEIMGKEASMGIILGITEGEYERDGRRREGGTEMERYQTYEEELEAVTEIMGKESSVGIMLGITEGGYEWGGGEGGQG